jgi:hypothetical protein
VPEEAENLMFPPNLAVTKFDPMGALFVEHLPLPDASDAVQRATPRVEKVTLPVGDPEPDVGTTVAT